MSVYFLLLLLAACNAVPFGYNDTDVNITSEWYNGSMVSPYENMTDEEIRIISEAESDLIFTDEQKAQMKQRMAEFSAVFWPAGVVPYVVDPSFYSLPQSSDLLQRAAVEFAKYTCIKLRPRQAGDFNYIVFAAGQGCSSRFGMTNGPQTIYISTRCNNYPQVILHEIGHALGLIHEQQRPDRDKFVRINYENIYPNMAFNFHKVPVQQSRMFPYDYSSMMHYDAWSFSMNRGFSMVAADARTTRSMGWYDTFSQGDIDRINYYYNCY